MTDAIDWADEALAEGWPLDRIEQIAESAARLRTVPTFIHRDVIVMEREPVTAPHSAPGARFTELREQGTARGVRAANTALDSVGMGQAA
jgi:hypothetical protein